MPDYGMTPYSWLCKECDERGVGGVIADAFGGFPERYRVSKELEKDFAEWANYFEDNVDCCSDNYDFDWETFHQKGIELAQRLNDEIGQHFNIVYVKPMEDPNRLLDERLLISKEKNFWLKFRQKLERLNENKM